MVQSEISIVWVKYPRPSLSKEPQRIVSKCFGLSRRSLENPPSPLVKIGMFWVTFLARRRYETFCAASGASSQNSRSRKTPNKHDEGAQAVARARWSRSKLTPRVQNTRLTLDFAKILLVFGSWIEILRVQQNQKVAVPCSQKQIVLHIQLRLEGIPSSLNTIPNRHTNRPIIPSLLFPFLNTACFQNENSWHVWVFSASWN